MIMNKSNVLIMTFATCIIGLISFSAIRENSCFEIDVIKQIKIKAGYCNTKN